MYCYVIHFLLQSTSSFFVLSLSFSHSLFYLLLSPLLARRRASLLHHVGKNFPILPRKLEFFPPDPESLSWMNSNPQMVFMRSNVFFARRSRPNSRNRKRSVDQSARIANAKREYEAAPASESSSGETCPDRGVDRSRTQAGPQTDRPNVTTFLRNR